LLGFEIARVDLKCIFQADTHILRIIDHTGQPDPCLLIALIRLDDLCKRGTRLIAPAGERGTDALFK
jgi:hypothetical protein